MPPSLLGLSPEELAAVAGAATAVGTLGLAVATYALARSTKQEVSAANRQAEASNIQVQLSQRQAEAAERALQAQIRPMLTDVPFGTPEVAGYSTKQTGSKSPFATFLGPREPHFRDASELHVWIDENSREVLADIPIRNVGNGSAVIESVSFLLGRPPHRVSGYTTSPVAPPRELVRVFVRPKGEDEAIASDVVKNRQDFSVVVCYRDVSGGESQAMRLDVHPDQGPDGDWSVRQVHWDKTIEAVIESPAQSSWPKP